MKKLMILLLVFLSVRGAINAQLIKDILVDAKNQVKWKVRWKIDDKINQAMDSLLTQPKKAIDKKQSKKEKKEQKKASGGQSRVQVKSNEDEEMKVEDGYIKLTVSTHEIFTGGRVIISGESLKYGNLSSVKLTITGGVEDEVETLQLDSKGGFIINWQANDDGYFVVTATSSDGKAKKSEKIRVIGIELEDEMAQGNIKELDRAMDKLDKEASTVKENLSANDRQELDKKLAEVKEKANAGRKLFTSLNEAQKKLSEIAKGKLIQNPLADNLSELKKELGSQQLEMERVNNATAHQPYDNTICEYMVMLNEACAAFSTITTLWTGSVKGLIKNIVLKKAVPTAVKTLSKAGNIGAPNDFVLKESSKIFGVCLADADYFTTKLGQATIAGDIVQYISELLMKKYCGVFKGEIKHDYEITYRNNAGARWWSYKYETGAAITLRYPKTNTGNVIKLKGNIEGNATSFDFFQDVEQMDDFREQMKGRAKLIPVEVMKPLAIPFATSQNDILGFGALARGLVTPSYFNIPVDGEYDVDAGLIKLFLNDPIIDFGPTVRYTYVYIAIAAGIPLFTKVDFPVNKAKVTLNAVIYQDNQLQVTKDGKNNLTIKGDGTRDIGSTSSPIQHSIHYHLTAKNDQ